MSDISGNDCNCADLELMRERQKQAWALAEQQLNARAVEKRERARLRVTNALLLEALEECMRWSPYKGESEETGHLRKCRAAIASARGSK